MFGIHLATASHVHTLKGARGMRKRNAIKETPSRSEPSSAWPN